MYVRTYVRTHAMLLEKRVIPFDGDDDDDDNNDDIDDTKKISAARKFSKN